MTTDALIEEVLTGGVNTVARVGETVRRPVGAWTPAVHDLLRHLADVGYAGSPRVLGIDERGREILDYIEGEVASYPLPAALVSDGALRSVGRLLRQFHDATLGFSVPAQACWYFAPREPAQVMCHGDFAPHNLVFREGLAVAVFDFDTVHPGPRVWDFAWTAFCFGLSTMDDSPNTSDDGSDRSDGSDSSTPTAERIRRVRVLADAYGLTAGEREALPDVTIARLRHLVAHIREQAAAGHPGFSTQVADGHDVHYLQAIEEIDGLRDAIATALGAVPQTGP
jgi:aminoglycoside phosphotransferase (APT) family kinase protein